MTDSLRSDLARLMLVEARHWSRVEDSAWIWGGQVGYDAGDGSNSWRWEDAEVPAELRSIAALKAEAQRLHRIAAALTDVARAV